MLTRFFQTLFRKLGLGLCIHNLQTNTLIYHVNIYDILISYKKLTNCGTKVADVPDTFSSCKHNANPSTIMVYLQLLCGKE